MDLLFRIKEIIYGYYRMTIWKLYNKKQRLRYFSDREKHNDRIISLEEYVQNTVPQTQEQKEVYDYISSKGLQCVFPYDFPQNYYLRAAIELHHDLDTGMFFAKRNGKQLYLRQEDYWSAKAYYRELASEQDEKSPHRYSLNKKHMNYLFDCGSAEGIFALDNIDKFDKIFLFEADETWLPALEKTFSKYGDKVEIIHCFLSDVCGGGNITLDQFVKDKDIPKDASIYVKMDVEGCEQSVLKGMDFILKNYSNLEMAVCTYHKQSDETEIKNIIDSYGRFRYKMSQGYMVLYYADDFYEPYLRRCLMFVEMG